MADPQKPAKGDGMTHSVEELVAFLRGAGPLDGVWFSEQHPTEKGAFWWRKHLHALTALQAERDALKAALARAYEAGRNDAAKTVRKSLRRAYEKQGREYVKYGEGWGSMASEEIYDEIEKAIKAALLKEVATYKRGASKNRRIRALTPPADLAERVSGTPDRGKMIRPAPDQAMCGGYPTGKGDSHE